MAAITPVWSCDARQVVLELLLYSSWDMQKGGWEISQPPVWFQSTFPTLPWEQASICTLLTSRIQASPTLLSVSVDSKEAMGLISSAWDAIIEMPRLWL